MCKNITRTNKITNLENIEMNKGGVNKTLVILESDINITQSKRNIE